MRIDSIFFASSNPGKILEIQQILAEVLPGVTVYSLQDFPQWSQEVDECGENYHDNALLKCQAFIDNQRGLPVLADDSGLEVDAFPGLLGVHSHRWCQSTGQPTAAKSLLEKMVGVSNRQAIFHTTICYLEPGQDPQFFDADLAGKIATVLSGNDGFDFDPIFIPQGYDTPYADIGQDVKNRISQRRQALDLFANYIKQN